jgi:cobalamin biosynthesis Mg chelatase CobN
LTARAITAAALFLLAADSFAADSKATIASLQARQATAEQTITQLRKELQEAREATADRVQAARSGLEFQVQDLENRNAIARQEITADRQLLTVKDDQLRQLAAQLAAEHLQTQTHTADSAKVATIAASAVKQAVTVANRRHDEQTKEIENTSTLASSAAEQSTQAARTGKENATALKGAQTQIAQLNRNVQQAEAKTRHLLIVGVSILMLILALLFFRRRFTAAAAASKIP